MWWLWFPYSQYPYLSSNIPESPACGVFVSQLIRYARVGSKYEDFLFRESILVTKLLKQGYSSRTTFRKLYGGHTDHTIWHLCVTYVEWSVHWLWHMTGFQLFWVNRDGCHMWGRNCSLFPEHLITLPLGSSWLYSFAIHIHCVCMNLSVSKDYVDWLMTLVCLSGCFVSDLFHKVGICVNISLNHSNNLWEVVSDHYLL